MKQQSSHPMQRFLVVAAVLCTATPVAAQFQKVRASIERTMVEHDMPSVAVAVAKDGEIIWEAGFGWADRERRLPATEHTMYSLASISKPITATGLMVLVERGLIDLDRPINDYLGDAKVNGRAFDEAGATVLRVANHTAGLPLHYQFFYRDEPYRRPPMDETIRRYANLVTPPGERWNYSNLGYGILDYVIERISGRSFADFMREEVFVPLGLNRMSVHIGPGLDDFAATRYTADGTPYPFYDFDHPGASAVYSSAHDLARFGMFHLGSRLPDQRRILTRASIERMQQPLAPRDDGSSYGIGWVVRTNEPLKRVLHGGGMGGVSTMLTLLPDQNAVVVVLSNASSPVPNEIAREIFAVLAPDAADPHARDGATGNEVALSEEELSRYAGSYDFGVMKASVTADEGRLILRRPHESSRLIHTEGGRFFVEDEPSTHLTFESADGDVTAVLDSGEVSVRGTQISAGPIFSPLCGLGGTWSGRVDTYHGGLPIVMEIRETGEVFVRLGGQPWTVLDGAVLDDGTLRGTFAGDLGTEDVNRRPYTLRLEIKKRGTKLNGALIAMSLPGQWLGNALAHWIEIHRVEG